MTIGLIPAAGHATRIHGLPKFLLPIGDSYLLDRLILRMNHDTDVKHVHIVGNSDNYLLLEQYKQDNCTVYLHNTKTMSETVLAVHKYTGRENVAFGMPDSYWTDENVYIKLLDDLHIRNAIVSLALFKMREGQHSHVGVVDAVHITSGFQDMGISIHNIIDKPRIAELQWCWGAMAWKPAFWKYIVASDPHVGFAAQRAIDAGETVTGVVMDGNYWDCGTPERYFEMIRAITK